MCDAYECHQSDESSLNHNSVNSSIESLSQKQDRRKTHFDDSICKKCSSPNPTVKVHAQGSHCKECFLLYANHKFRSTIGKEGIVPYGARVVLGYSGGLSSTAMVKLMGDTLKETKKKANLNFNIKCVNVSLTTSADGGSDDFSDGMTRFVQQMGFELTVISASDWLKLHSEITLSEYLKTNDETLRIDRESKLIRSILTHFCSQVEFHWLMLGQSLFRSAVNVLSDVCMGRGMDIGSISNFSDSRLEETESLKTVFPMKEFTSKEIAFFNQFKGLPNFQLPSSETSSNFNSSIQRLTENFLLNLQKDFPASVPNARNSGEKVLPRKLNSTVNCCCLCLMPLNTFENGGIDDVEGVMHKDNAHNSAAFSQKICSSEDSNCASAPNTSLLCNFCQFDNAVLNFS